jgi:uncharacterized delta-60 repeat protein
MVTKSTKMARFSKLAGLTLAVISGLLVISQAAIAKPQPGDLDHSFGDKGVVSTRVDGMKAYTASVAIDRSNRIVAAGSTSQSGFLFARYKPNGELDSSFSGDGMQSVAFRAVDDPASVAIGKGGTITVAGTGCVRVGECGFSLARLTANGELDQGFGDGGKVTIRFGSVLEGGTPLAIDSRGRAVVAGTTCRGPHGKVHCDFAAIRLKQNGALDPSFGKDGRVATNIAPHEHKAFVSLNAMAIDSRGRIIVAGDRSRPDRVVLVRYKKDGQQDGSFGHHGIVEKSLDRLGGIQGIAITPKDKIVAAGSYKPNARRKWALARFGRSGGLDHSFGNGGQVATHIPASGNSEVQAVAIDSKNRIVATGKPDYSVARFQPNGKLNRSFGHRGTVTEEFGASFAGALAIDSRNRPVVAGGYPNFFLARFLG